MLVGYSQGALAIRMAIDLMSYNDKILSTYVIGDPF